MGTTKIQKRGPDTNQITGQMNFADLFNTGFGLTTDEKIIKYLFDTREFCDYCGWFNDLKNAYLSGKDLVEESQKMFATCSELSNVIFKTHSDLDFSELDRRRVGVRYMCNGVEINYNGAYLDKKVWKRIRLNYKQVAAEIEKRICLAS